MVVTDDTSVEQQRHLILARRSCLLISIAASDVPVSLSETQEVALFFPPHSWLCEGEGINFAPFVTLLACQEFESYLLCCSSVSRL